MDLKVFIDLLSGNDEGLIKKIMEQEETRRRIEIGSNIVAILHILVENKITTEERIKEVQEIYKKEIAKEQIKLIKEDLKKYKKESE